MSHMSIRVSSGGERTSHGTQLRRLVRIPSSPRPLYRGVPDFTNADREIDSGRLSRAVERARTNNRPREEIRRASGVSARRLSVRLRRREREVDHDKEPPLGIVAQLPLYLGECITPLKGLD
ncbi:hypothetical protein CR513_09115, partial [Mucuna pruriens]